MISADTRVPPGSMMSPAFGAMLSSGSTLLPSTPVEKYKDEVREMWAQLMPQEVEAGDIRHEL
jgi:hypothetical protein